MVDVLLMTTRRHIIARYHYAIDVSAGGTGSLTLWDGEGNRIGVIGCLDENTLLPPPRLAADLLSVAAFIHSSRMPALLDMLRHERGTALCLDDTAPGFATFETSTALIDCAAPSAARAKET